MHIFYNCQCRSDVYEIRSQRSDRRFDCKRDLQVRQIVKSVHNLNCYEANYFRRPEPYALWKPWVRAIFQDSRLSETWENYIAEDLGATIGTATFIFRHATCRFIDVKEGLGYRSSLDTKLFCCYVEAAIAYFVQHDFTTRSVREYLATVLMATRKFAEAAEAFASTNHPLMDNDATL